MMNGPPMLSGRYAEDILRLRNYLQQMSQQINIMQQTIQEIQDTLTAGGNSNGE